LPTTGWLQWRAPLPPRSGLGLAHNCTFNLLARASTSMRPVTPLRHCDTIAGAQTSCGRAYTSHRAQSELTDLQPIKTRRSKLDLCRRRPSRRRPPASADADRERRRRAPSHSPPTLPSRAARRRCRRRRHSHLRQQTTSRRNIDHRGTKCTAFDTSLQCISLHRRTLLAQHIDIQLRAIARGDRLEIAARCRREIVHSDV
jgi:hypothetical protein